MVKISKSPIFKEIEPQNMPKSVDTEIISSMVCRYFEVFGSLDRNAYRLKTTKIMGG